MQMDHLRCKKPNRVLGVKVPFLTAASRYQLGEGTLRTFLSGGDFWKKLREVADKTNSLNTLYPLVTNDHLNLEISPSAVCTSGIDAVRCVFLD